MNYLIEMTLLSDALPGNGEGLSSIVDIDVSYDRWGIPYIPGKRLKGILRESAYEIGKSNILKHAPVEIFGKSDASSAGPFRLGNGKIKNYDHVVAALESLKLEVDWQKILIPRIILKYFTYERACTAIEENGMAKEGSLRTMRVLKKGLIFEFPLTCPEEFEDDLEKICKATRFLGISRSRGLGHIRLNLRKLNHQNFASKVSSSLNPEVEVEAEIIFSNIDPLLVTYEVGKTQYSNSFIPGQVILGALSTLYIEKYPERRPFQEDPDFRALFLDGHVVYKPAYIMIEGERSIPAPHHIVKEKDKSKYFNLLCEEDIDILHKEDVQVKGGLKEFCIIHDQVIYHKNVSQRIEYHHRRPADKKKGHPLENEGEFFQFTVMEPEQTFAARILGPFHLVELILQLLNDRGYFLLGKSKTAQYGECRLVDMKIKPRRIPSVSLEPKETVSLLCETDVWVRNKNGFPEPSLEVLHKNICEKVGCSSSQLRLVPEKTFLGHRHIGGFMGVWKLPKPFKSILTAGSVITLENISNKPMDLTPLLKKGIGEHTWEGFGWVMLNPCNSKTPCVKDGSSHLIQKEWTLDETLRPLCEHLIVHKIRNKIEQQAISEGQKFAIRLNNTFISFLENVYWQVEQYDNLIHYFSNLRKIRCDHLSRVAQKLFLKKTQNRQNHSFLVQQDNWQNFFNKLCKRELEIQINNQAVFHKDEITRLQEAMYFLYCRTFLNFVKLKLRGSKV